MKTLVDMNRTVLNSNGWTADGTKQFYRVSRWIAVKHNYKPNKRNALWDYVMDENGYKPYNSGFNADNGLFLDYFTWNGRNYALEQFLSIGNPFYVPFTLCYETKDGKLHYLAGIDGENIYDPIYIEFDECCGNVRIYTEV